MNTCIHSFLQYFEVIINPAEGKDIITKKKSRNSKINATAFSSPDRLNMREVMNRQQNARHNPAP